MSYLLLAMQSRAVVGCCVARCGPGGVALRGLFTTFADTKYMYILYGDKARYNAS